MTVGCPSLNVERGLPSICDTCAPHYWISACGQGTMKLNYISGIILKNLFHLKPFHGERTVFFVYVDDKMKI